MFKPIYQTGIVYDATHPECLLDLCRPEGAEKPPLLVYFHGGGLEAGSRTISKALESLVTTHGIAVASADYRMYPTAHYPDFVVDAAAAVAYVQNTLCKTGEYGKLYVGGSSAGGYLSMMLCFATDFLTRAGGDPLAVDGYVLDAGQPMTHYNVLRERGIDPRCVRVDEAAPLWYITKPFTPQSHTPPLLILTAEHDMVNRREQNVVFHTALTHFGYPAEKIRFKTMLGFGHCQYDEAADPDGRFLFAEEIAAFLKLYK